MTAIRIGTRSLLELLRVLACTAGDDSEGPLATILLHTARADRAEQPGKTDVLVGTSTNGHTAGHLNTSVSGQLARATLWGIDDVHALLASFKPKTKGAAGLEHAVEIRVTGDTVTVSEDPDLFKEGFTLQFTEKSVHDFPRNTWSMLSDVHINPAPPDPTTGRPVLPAARTDYAYDLVAPFTRVAKMLGAHLELYRYHQFVPVLVQVGTRYRGLLSTIRWDAEGTFPDAPDAGVYPPDLPPPPDPDAVDPDATTKVGILRVDDEDVDEPIADFPAVTRDPSRLLAAAEHVITTQFASKSDLAKALKVGYPTASGLMDQLEERGLIGPRVGSKTRAILAQPDDLAAVLEAIRGPHDAAVSGEDDES